LFAAIDADLRVATVFGVVDAELVCHVVCLFTPSFFSLQNSGDRSWCGVVVRTLVLADELSLSCTRLLAGRTATLWLKHPLSVSQLCQLSLPGLWGR